MEISQEEKIRQMIASLPLDEQAEVLKRFSSRLDNLSELADATIKEFQKEKAEREQTAKYDELAGLLKNPRANSARIRVVSGSK